MRRYTWPHSTRDVATHLVRHGLDLRGRQQDSKVRNLEVGHADASAGMGCR
jgi:hypothetical protein